MQLKLHPTAFGSQVGTRRRFVYTGPDGERRNLGTGWKTIRHAYEFIERAYRGHPHQRAALASLREEILA